MYDQNTGINDGPVREPENVENNNERGEPAHPGPSQVDDKQLFDQNFMNRYVKEQIGLDPVLEGQDEQEENDSWQ